MIHIYTGNGKGKTTAAYGLCLRARGWGKKCCLIQFLKSRGFVYGEAIAAKRLKIKIICLNQKHPIFCPKLKPQHDSKLKESIKSGLDKVKDIVLSKKYEVIVLDEIINALCQGYLNESALIKLLKITPKSTELILTGRGRISRRLKKYSDYITEMREIKHPFKNKIPARQGIEF